MILVRLPTGDQLDAPAAASYMRMSMQYGDLLPITSAFRPTEEQRRLRDLFLAGKGAYALPPGQSWHERGLAVDFGRVVWLWLDRNAPAHGWVRTNPNELWHWEYRESRDTYLGGTAHDEGEDDDMTPDQARMLAELHQVVFGGGPGTPVDQTLYQRVKRMEEVVYQGGAGTPVDQTLYQRVKALPAAVWDQYVAAADPETGQVERHPMWEWVTLTTYRALHLFRR